MTTNEVSCKAIAYSAWLSGKRAPVPACKRIVKIMEQIKSRCGDLRPCVSDAIQEIRPEDWVAIKDEAKSRA